MTAQIPLTVIGGFLGAGKTTLLNRLLSANHGVRFAVLVNDFGDLVIDADLVQQHGGDTITFANGCVCCTLGDNFMLTLDQLLTSANPPEQILIEASGVADPRSLADIAILHPQLKPDLTLILADASSIVERAADELLEDTVKRQINAADVLLMNKCDLVAKEQKTAAQQWLQQQSQVPVIETRYADIPITLLAEKSVLPKSSAYQHNHSHTDAFVSITLKLEQPVNIETLRERLGGLPTSILRVKGFVKSTANKAEFYLVQRSGNYVSIDKWQHNIDNPLGLMFIGTHAMPGIDQINAALFNAS